MNWLKIDKPYRLRSCTLLKDEFLGMRNFLILSCCFLFVRLWASHLVDFPDLTIALDASDMQAITIWHHYTCKCYANLYTTIHPTLP